MLNLHMVTRWQHLTRIYDVYFGFGRRKHIRIICIVIYLLFNQSMIEKFSFEIYVL